MSEWTGERKCGECIYHAVGKCCKWVCDFTSVKEAENAVKKERLGKAQNNMSKEIAV